MRPELHHWVLKSGSRWIQFRRPREWREAHVLSDIPRLLEDVERWAREGDWAVGALAYEAAPAFDPAFRTHPPASGVPLAMFGRYAGPEDWETSPAEDPEALAFAPGEWSPGVDRRAYDGAMEEIRARISRGEIYQANLTFPLRARAVSGGWPLFCAMEAAHRAVFAAYVRTGAGEMCSLSPELFFELCGDAIRSVPMKGTRRRGRWMEEDAALADELEKSAKDRAENVMITDMVRNDLGRICEPGSIVVPRLCETERHAWVWQMISTVAGRTRAGFQDILGALFPAASITGAPKVRAMRTIAEMESGPRGFYTGAIGWWAPGRRARFSVAIRSAWVSASGDRATYGVGGGIVWDSRSDDEYAEACAKGPRSGRAIPFELLETMRWNPAGGYEQWPRHAARLAESARYFGFEMDLSVVETELARAASSFPESPRRVRLLVNARGIARVEDGPMPALDHPRRLALSRESVDSKDLFLYHKTTRREVYERHRAAHPLADDVLLWNERGEVTETCMANVVVEMEGERWTPPRSCGLLAGTARAHLLESGYCRERVISVEEAIRAGRWWTVNAVRGLVSARLMA